MLIRRPDDIPSSLITPKDQYLNRRRFLRGAASGLATAGAGSVPAAVAGDVIRSMLMVQLRSVLMKAIVGVAIGLGLFVYGRGVPGRQEPAGTPRPASPAAR